MRAYVLGTNAVLSYLKSGDIPLELGDDFHPIKAEPSLDKPDFEIVDFFVNCGIPRERSMKYSRNFSENGIDESVFPHLTHDILKEVASHLFKAHS